MINQSPFMRQDLGLSTPLFHRNLPRDHPALRLQSPPESDPAIGSLLQLNIPSLVRVKPGVISRIGLYLCRESIDPVVVLSSPLPDSILQRASQSILEQGVHFSDWLNVDGNQFEDAIRIFETLPKNIRGIVAIGGDKTLNLGKYIAFLAQLPYIAVPTSLSNDGFCSPKSSLTHHCRKRRFPTWMPRGVIVDVDVCLKAPKILWCAGVGDLVSKLTATDDWKLAFHATGEQVDDFAALLSDATVKQFIAEPRHDITGMTLLANALMLNGIAMKICGSSRPASGAEHLISQALDLCAERPALHGLQVGLATYITSQLQGQRSTEIIDELFKKTGFWEIIKKNPFSRAEWIKAIEMAPTLKRNYYTVLSSRDCLPEVEQLIQNDPSLQGCFE